jgi:DNA-directed RNA polymerase subunit N (RpoN/RPB10)
MPIQASLGARLVSTSQVPTFSGMGVPDIASSGLPIDLALMPAICYSCNKRVFQLRIERELEMGKSIAQIMDEQGYVKICCRRTILTSVPVVHLQQQLAHQQQIINQMGNMTVEETGLPSYPHLNRVDLGGSLQVLESVPPGVGPIGILPFVENPQGELPQGEPISADVNPFEYYMGQVSEHNDDFDE